MQELMVALACLYDVALEEDLHYITQKLNCRKYHEGNGKSRLKWLRHTKSFGL